MEAPPDSRRSFCPACGKMVTYADDLTAIHLAKPDRRDIKRKVEDQGLKKDLSLKRLNLAMNKKKTQFLTAMNYQRRKPGHINKDPNKRFDSPIDVEIDGNKITENSFLKTLGVSFDNEVNFKIHWENTVKTCWNKIYALNHLRNHINHDLRKEF